MRIFNIILFLSFFLIQVGFGQHYRSNKSAVSFFSSATLEDISAESIKGTSVIDLGKNQMAFSIPINSFEFDKSLMKEHFNEKYMESDKFPKSTFVGKIAGFDSSRNGIQKTQAEGEMTIHGVTKKIKIEGAIEKKGNLLLLSSSFIIRLEDYKVKIPKLLWQNIAEQVEVKINFEYEKIN